jgi:hypothetical protein
MAMTRLIDADALNREIDKVECYSRDPYVTYMSECIANAPTVDALPYDYILNIEEELRQKANESESQEQKEFYLQNADAIQRLLITWEVKGRGTVRGYD